MEVRAPSKVANHTREDFSALSWESGESVVSELSSAGSNSNNSNNNILLILRLL